ncbi:hypothetical protein DQ384_00300 [Sphaerisporangium album]|uniref:Uncharacterized protein n=1 Tax=Sphaerisporangium album TaxID=509200 RepID=A0A367FTC2_9ACTN|nr:hypothetical protein [Sphaerisporangium album]RCG32937.1 hypothetical protein DQ384_00300 [Sphaerisporangium album]
MPSPALDVQAARAPATTAGPPGAVAGIRRVDGELAEPGRTLNPGRAADHTDRRLNDIAEKGARP